VLTQAEAEGIIPQGQGPALDEYRVRAHIHPPANPLNHVLSVAVKPAEMVFRASAKVYSKRVVRLTP